MSMQPQSLPAMPEATQGVVPVTFPTEKIGLELPPSLDLATTVAKFQVLTTGTDPNEVRQGRKYTLALRCDPSSNTPYIVITYYSGKYRPHTHIHTDDFEDHLAMLAKAKELMQRRFSHGYTLIWWDEDFPLLDWVRKHEYPIQQSELPADDYPSIQLPLPLFTKLNY